MELQRYCQRLVRLVASQDDTAEERKRKEIWFPMVSGLAVVAVAYDLASLGLQLEHPLLMRVLATHWASIGCIVSALYPLITHRLPITFVAIAPMWLIAGVLMADVSFASERNSFRPWTFVVLIMDVYLALGVPRFYQHCVLCSTTLALFVTNLEDSLRLGIYDAEGLFRGDGFFYDAFCDCAQPPCGQGIMQIPWFILPCMVLYLDFFATRSFAEGLRREQGAVEASIVTAQLVADGLARFDLATAEGVLDQAGEQLPLGLSVGFRRLLHNLARYRPHLPQSCFEEGEAAAVSTSSDADPTPQAASLKDCAARDVPSPHPRRRWHPLSPLTIRSARVSEGSFRRGASLESSPTGVSLGGFSIEGYHPVRRVRRVTLLVRNRSGFLAAAQECADTVQQWVATELEHFTLTVSGQGGVSDILSGDHFFATFGAVKTQGSQCSAAIRVALRLAEQTESRGLTALRSTASVCAGSALCGDFGNMRTQRFMVIGAVSSFAVVMERAAAAWSISVLISAVVHAEVEPLWSCRLRRYVTFPKLDPSPTALWEVMEGRMSDAEPEEWMYELAAARQNPWDMYNLAVELWSSASPVAKLRDVISSGLEQAAPGGAVADALLAVQESLQSAPAPVGSFAAEALAGEPSPVALRREPTASVTAETMKQPASSAAASPSTELLTTPRSDLPVSATHGSP